MGTPPLPRNLLTKIEDTCQVHHLEMTVSEVPVVFENPSYHGPNPARPETTSAFPFGTEKIVSAGNALLPVEPLTARV